MPANSDARSRNENDPALLQRVFSLQVQELKLREKDLELRKAELESNDKLAREAIEAQSKSETEHAQAFHVLVRFRYFCLGLAIVSITAFGIVALVTRQSEVALEVAKAIGFAAMGFFAGVGKAKWDASKKREQ